MKQEIQDSIISRLISQDKFNPNEETKKVKLIKVSTDEEVLKEIFLLNETIEYWNQEEYESMKYSFESSGITFGDNGYSKNVRIGDYIVVVDSGYSYPITTLEELKVMYAMLGDSQMIMKIGTLQEISIDSIPMSMRDGSTEAEIIENYKKFILS